MKTKMIAGILVLALVVTSIGVVSARGYFGASASTSAPTAEGGWSGGPRRMGQLAEEQRQEMQEQMHEYRKELFEQYGIDLTEEERQEMHQQIHEFRQQIREQYNLTCPMGPQFVDEDGDGICDHKGDYGQGYQHGHGFRWFAETPTPEE